MELRELKESEELLDDLEQREILARLESQEGMELMVCPAATVGPEAGANLDVRAPKETQEQLVCLGALDNVAVLVYLVPRELR